MGTSVNMQTLKEMPEGFYANLFIQVFADINTGETGRSVKRQISYYLRRQGKT